MIEIIELKKGNNYDYLHSYIHILTVADEIHLLETQSQISIVPLKFPNPPRHKSKISGKEQYTLESKVCNTQLTCKKSHINITQQ